MGADSLDPRFARLESDRACSACSASSSATGMLTPKYARLACRYAWRRLLTPAGWRWQTDGLLFFGRSCRSRSAAGDDPLRALRLGRRRDEDPLPRGRGRDRAEDRARAGMHDLGLPARPDRRAVRDRRPGHVHRLRPRARSRSTARSASRASTSATSTWARTSGSATAPASCGACESATTRDRNQLGRHAGCARRTRWSAASPPASSGCARRRRRSLAGPGGARAGGGAGAPDGGAE